MIKNPKKIFANKLRQNPTSAERWLWAALENRKIGPRCRRQRVVGKYIVDFYIPTWKLAVEVDGSIHDSQVDYDLSRDRFIRSQGIHLIRFDNDVVMSDRDACVRQIIEYGEYFEASAKKAAGLTKLRANILERQNLRRVMRRARKMQSDAA